MRLCHVNSIVQLAATVVLLQPVLAHDEIISEDDAHFLRQQAELLVNGARLAPGESRQGIQNSTQYVVHLPGVNMTYRAFWPRDAAMMLGGGLVPPEEIEGWIRLECSTIQGPEAWRVRDGVEISAYAVPDHINLDGTGSFYPGNYKTGSDQGGSPFGKYPPYDDSFYFIITVYQHSRAAGDMSLFQSPMSTSFGNVKLSDLCDKVYSGIPSDDVSGLVVAGDIDSENAKDFGFCDSVFKSGKLLFASILKYVAAKNLAEMYRGIGDPDKSAYYEVEASRISDAIASAFYCKTAEEADIERGWLHAATGVGNQPDVWGSAYAIWSGAVQGATADRVSRSLVAAYRDGTAVHNGFVRHILTTDETNNGGWQKSIYDVGHYQNGGYWGTPTGWYIAAMHHTDPGAAKDMARDYLKNLRDHRDPDGMSLAWEWVNPSLGIQANPLYVSTVALPYVSLLEAGLLPEPHSSE